MAISRLKFIPNTKLTTRKISSYRLEKTNKIESANEEENLNRDKLLSRRIVKEIIERNTEITRDHLTPELQLRLLTPTCRLYNEPVNDNSILSNNNIESKVFHEPFWSIYWPGGQALTRFILDHGNELLNKSKGFTTFLDFGSGSGASAIAAKIIGATKVIANDINKVACVAAKLNAALNKVDIEISSENLLENREWQNEWSSDVILVGDLLYDDEIAKILIPRLEEASFRNGSQIYLGDPGRHALTEALKSRMKLRRKYSLPENVRKENYGFNTATVWQFK